jgi:peptidoglycan/xylan/chitin deacetylase (PgdA/CDA1 family)
MSIDKKNAIITFDYEVFLGRETGTTENCVIHPTESILKVLRENNAKAIFFVDAAWLLFIKENFSDDFDLVSGQLKSVIESGSSVELHLHPQWISAYKKADQITLNSLQHYKLHLLSSEEINDLFKRSIDLLQSITDQKIRCFRAGGWCIEPFAPLKPTFDSFNIKYDFSIVPGMFIREGKAYDFDHSGAPELPFYRFNEDILNPDSDGHYYEFPVTTFKSNPFYRVVNKILLKFKRDAIFGDGIGLKERKYFTPVTLVRLFKFSKATLTLDKTNNLFFKYLLKIHFKKSCLLVIISHPKTFSGQALENLSYIVKKYVTLNSEDLDNFVKLAK